MTPEPPPPLAGVEPPAARSEDRADAEPGPAEGNRFFRWVRGLGLERRSGWLGGVCAGVAARLGIDPLIVRGIVLVAAVFAAPVVFLYLAAWMLLPDAEAEGRIHLEALLAGRFDAANIGLLVLLVASVIPMTQTFWLASQSWFSQYLGVWLFAGLSLPVLGVLIVAALIILVVWVATRSHTPRGAARTASAGAPGHPEASDAEPAAFAAEAQTAPAAAPAPPAAPAPEGEEAARPGESAELAAWREQHEAWRRERGEWKAGQQEAEKLAKARWAAEYRADAAAFARQAAAAKRARRASRPRTSFAYVATVLGAALLVGAFLALGPTDSNGVGGLDDDAWSIGLAAGAFVVATGMVVAGVLRRRSGFLAFVATAALLASIGLAAVPRDVTLLWPNAWLSSPQSLRGDVLQPVGTLGISVTPGISAKDVDLRVDKRSGQVSLDLDVRQGEALDVRISLDEGTLAYRSIDVNGDVAVSVPTPIGGLDSGVWEFRIGNPRFVEAGSIEVHIDSGDVSLLDMTEGE